MRGLSIALQNASYRCSVVLIFAPDETEGSLSTKKAAMRICHELGLTYWLLEDKAIANSLGIETIPTLGIIEREKFTKVRPGRAAEIDIRVFLVDAYRERGVIL